jgi:type II secretion system protein G
MLKLRKMLKKNRKGFTLIELIVVLAILAIIALLAIPRFLGTLENAERTTDEAQARTLASAVQLFRAEVGRYPTGLEELEADDTTDASGSGNTYGPYIDKVPDLQYYSDYTYSSTDGSVGLADPE